MKNKILQLGRATLRRAVTLPLIIFTLAFLIGLRAQVVMFGSPPVLTGTVLSSVLSAPQVGVSIRPVSLTLSGMYSNTPGSSEVFNLVATIDGINYLVIGSFTNTGTNNLTTNFPASATNLAVSLYWQAVLGTNRVSASAIYGP